MGWRWTTCPSKGPTLLANDPGESLKTETRLGELGLGQPGVGLRRYGTPDPRISPSSTGKGLRHGDTVLVGFGGGPCLEYLQGLNSCENLRRQLIKFNPDE